MRRPLVVQMNNDLSAGAKQAMLSSAKDKRKPAHFAQYPKLQDRLDYEELILVGHTEDPLSLGRINILKHTLGGKSVDEIADNLAKKYKNNEDTLKHLYLDGCNPGLWYENAKGEFTSFAKELAEKLAEKGFTQVFVHAIASPVISGKLGMVSLAPKEAARHESIGYFIFKDPDDMYKRLETEGDKALNAHDSFTVTEIGAMVFDETLMDF